MTDAGSGPDESLAGQRLRVASLASCEDRIRALREQECNLDVEHIAAEAALHSATNRLQPDIDPTLASRIGRSLERRRALEDGRCESSEENSHRSSDSSRRLDQLRAGHAALQVWLDASQPREPGPVAHAAKAALLIAIGATVWAAIAMHPAFLLLLVVVVGPVSFAMGRGQDADWRRVGARRRFAASGLSDIATWNEDTVRARLLELESSLAATNRDSLVEDAVAPHRDPVDAQTVAVQVAEEDVQIAFNLDAAGLTMIDTEGELGNWLRLVARADRSRESLERVKKEYTQQRAEANELRDQLLRYLHSRGVRPTEHQDTAAAIAERLDRLPESPVGPGEA